MKIETGEPRETGHYVCWLPGVGFPTVVRFWLAGGHGWLNNLKEPVAGDVAGWLGPLPLIEKSWDEVFSDLRKTEHGSYVAEHKTTLEFDL